MYYNGTLSPISPKQEGEVRVAQDKNARRYQAEQYVHLRIPRTTVSEQTYPATSRVGSIIAPGIVDQLEVHQYVQHRQEYGNGTDEISQDKGFDGGGDHPADALSLVEEHAAEVDRPALVDQIRQLERRHQQYRDGQRRARKDKVEEVLLRHRYAPVGTGFGRVVKVPGGGQGGILEGQYDAREGEQEPHRVDAVVVRPCRSKLGRPSTAQEVEHHEDGISGHQGRRWFGIRRVYQSHGYWQNEHLAPQNSELL